MDRDMTVGAVFEEIAELVAEASTLALNGERIAALGRLRLAALEITRWDDLLDGRPDYAALKRARDVAEAALCDERASTHRGASTRARVRRPVAAFDLAA